MFSFQAFVLKGSHHHFGRENLNKNSISTKNMSNGTISLRIEVKKLSFSDFMFISVDQSSSIHNSIKDVFSGFLDSKTL
jgi:hypothetical protein